MAEFTPRSVFYTKYSSFHRKCHQIREYVLLALGTKLAQEMVGKC